MLNFSCGLYPLVGVLFLFDGPDAVSNKDPSWIWLLLWPLLSPVDPQSQQDP